MIEFLSTWAKNLGLAIVVVSILEMLLPNNRTKKYIRMVMGVYIIFSIVSPFIKNKEIFDIEKFNIENYASEQTSTVIDQTSMDNRIQELYIQELEKDIIKKLEKQGYEILKCKVSVNLSDSEEETKISKIKVNVKSKEKIEDKKQEKIENKIVTQIQKIKKVDTKIENDSDNKNIQEKENNEKNEKENKITKVDIQNIKKILMEEYEVSEKCLEIN